MAEDADLAYLASKMGINLEDLKKERQEKEKQALAAVGDEKIKQMKRPWAARDAMLEELFLKDYGYRFFLTLNGKRLKKVTNLNDFKCGQCGESINIGGCCRGIAEIPGDFVSYTGNPLCKWVAVPALTYEVECKNKHVNQILIQQLLG